MTIKEFKPGQEVYALTRTRGRLTEHFVKRYTVLSVGRKYVKAAPLGGKMPVEFYKQQEADEYLVENKDWGDRMKLFLTEEGAMGDIEKDMLKTWLRKAVDGYKIEDYTLEQLRAVRKILEGQDNG